MRLKGWWIQLMISFLILTRAAAQDLLLEGITTVKIYNDNPENEIPVYAQIFHSFPIWDHSEIMDTISVTKKQVWLRCPVRNLQVGHISIESKTFPLLMIPGDTIHISLSGSSKAPKFEFSGKTKDIQPYYMARAMRFPISVDQLMMNAGMTAANLNKFKVKADSLYSLDQQFWEGWKQKQSFPAWFIRYQSDAIRYRNALLRVYILTYQTLVQRKGDEIPNDYFEFLKTIPLRNEAAMYDFYYLRFLYDYLKYKSGAGTENASQDLEFKLAKEMLGDNVGDFYIISSISSGLISNPVKVKTDLARFTFPTTYQYLTNYLLDRVEAYNKKLNPGDTAPEFILEDTRDSLISLSQFKDHVVYLSFWFPGCKGCIQEFPFENAMVQKFQGKPVKIISICTKSSKPKWMAMIEKYDLKTLNLYADASWQKKLEEKYVINVYPHYVLIDGEGRVIENFATRPSEGVSKKIEAAVKDLKDQ